MITALYSCDLCGIKRREVQIPARATEDVVVWFRDIVTPILCEDHAKQSPECQPKTLKEVLIPMPPESEFIGQQIE